MSDLFTPNDIRALLEGALLSEPITEAAQVLWRGVAAETLTRNHGRAENASTGLKTLRASDAGRCAREVFADLHDLRDLPESAEGLLKMANGSLTGAWLACLLGAAFEAQGYRAKAEVELARDGITGHADLVIFSVHESAAHDGTVDVPWLVVEFKCSAWTGKHDGAKPYHLLQAAQYAKMVGASEFVIVQYFPSTQARFDKSLGTKVSEPHIEPSQLYQTDDFLEATENEYARLRVALGNTEPDGDPSEAWRCSFCRYGGCPRNTNARNPRPKPRQVHGIA